MLVPFEHDMTYGRLFLSQTKINHLHQLIGIRDGEVRQYTWNLRLAHGLEAGHQRGENFGLCSISISFAAGFPATNQ